MSIWDKTPEELASERTKATNSEIQNQTAFLMYMLGLIKDAVEENKSVEVENTVREIVGKVAVERPEWIKELIPNTLPVEKKLDVIAKAIVDKKVLDRMDFNRPEWLSEIIPKEIQFPDPKDFSKPQTDLLRELLKAVKEKEITKEVTVINPIEIKEPKWWSLPDFEKPLKALQTSLFSFFEKKTFKTTVENDLDVKVKNKVDVTVLNPQESISLKNIGEVTKRLDLLSMQLKALGSTGSNSSGGSGGSGGDASEATLVNILSAVDGLEAAVAGLGTEATLAKLPGISIPIHDYIAAAYPDTVTETYTFKTGGAGGATVCTVTVVYVNATKERLLTVTKS